MGEKKGKTMASWKIDYKKCDQTSGLKFLNDTVN